VRLEEEEIMFFSLKSCNKRRKKEKVDQTSSQFTRAWKLEMVVNSIEVVYNREEKYLFI
jgi:hypothetical protein